MATIVVAGTSVVARLVGGRIVARLPMAGFTVGLAAVQAVALVALAFAETTVALFAAIILFGATIGNILMLQPLLIAERFGVLDYPRLFSRAQFITRARRGRWAAAARLAVRQRRRLPHVVHRRRVLLAGRGVRAGVRLVPLPCATRDATSHPNVRRVVDAAAEAGLEIEPVRFPDGAKTAADAAAAIGVDVGQIVKSLIFAVDGEVVLAFVSGANQLDESKLAAAAGGSRARESTPTPCAR